MARAGWRVAVEEVANGSFNGGFCDWCHIFIDPAVSGGFERIDGGRLWCGLCPRFPATEALHDADRVARRAQRLLRELEPERLDEFEADLDMLSGAVADLRMILDQRRGLRPATCGVRQPRVIGMMCPGGRSRAAPATGSVRIFHTILKAGPCGRPPASSPTLIRVHSGGCGSGQVSSP